MARPKRLLTLGHSYCVALNRRIANEIAAAGAGEWEVTTVAPSAFHADYGWMEMERDPQEKSNLEPAPVYFSSRVHTMLYGRRLADLMREPWDVVHCWEEPYIFAGAQVAHWARRDSRLVYWTYQNISKRYPPPFSWVEQYCVDRCSGWIAAGQSVKQTLSSRGYDRRPHAIISPGVDLGLFYPDRPAGEVIRRRLGWESPSPLVIGYLGRFVPQKGLEFFTNVLNGLPVPWRAIFIGGGPMEAFLRDWAKPHGDKVRIVTGVRHNEVPAYLNATDLLCAPSQTTPRWREQFGRMLIEAFACGLPVIASDCGEIPYVVGDAGVIVGERDAEAWSLAISQLVDNSSQRSELSARAVERARQNFGWPVIARKHLDFFDDLLSTGTARPN